MEFQTTTAISVQVRSLCDLLQTAMVGETITFDDMNRQLGINIKHYRYVLEQARQKLLEEQGIRFDSVFAKGLKRMHIDDLVGVSDRTIKKLRRGARTANKRIDQQLSRANDVDDATRFALNSRRSLLGTIEAIASKKTVDAIQKIDDTRVVPFGRVLEALK